MGCTAVIDPIAGWRIDESETSEPVEVQRRRVRERDVLAFLVLVAVTCTMLTSAVAFAFVV